MYLLVYLNCACLHLCLSLYDNFQFMVHNETHYVSSFLNNKVTLICLSQNIEPLISPFCLFDKVNFFTFCYI